MIQPVLPLFSEKAKAKATEEKEAKGPAKATAAKVKEEVLLFLHKRQ